MDKQDRLFVRDGRKHYRRKYSLTEVKIGVAIVAGLFAIASWVAWKGRHPDPELYKEAPSLVNRSRGTVDRGPVPDRLASEGWKEGEISSFGTEDLYVKINGREGYYKSFGFQKLWFVALTEKDRSIDIELYDLGNVGNAIGAFSGEVPDTATTTVDLGLVAIDRNAIFLVRGRWYVRAIGSDESSETKTALARIASLFTEKLEGEPLPGSFDLFVALGVAPGKISFYPENAFSFGFAKDVHAGLLPDGETELFVVLTPNETDAQTMAKQFSDGFLQYGRKVGDRWIEDQYLQRISGAKSSGRMVVGIRGASDVKAASSLLARLEERAKSVSMESPPPPKAAPVEEYQ